MKKSILIIFSIFFFQLSAFAGGPWSQTKGKYYLKLSEWWTVFDQHFTDTGMLDPNVTTGIFNTTLYGEIGLSDRFTGLINASLFSRNYMNNLRSETTGEIIVAGEGLNSLGDIDLGIKYSLTGNTSFPISISLILGIPSGKTAGGTLNNLATGDGEFNQIIQIDCGKGFELGSLPAYFSAYLGFNNRTNNFSEEIRGGGEFGVGMLNKKLWLSTKLNIVESLKNGATAESINTTSVFSNNTEFVGIGLEANYYITQKVGVSLSAAGALRAEIIAAAPSFSVGFFYDMSK